MRNSKGFSLIELLIVGGRDHSDHRGDCDPQLAARANRSQWSFGCPVIAPNQHGWVRL